MKRFLCGICFYVLLSFIFVIIPARGSVSGATECVTNGSSGEINYSVEFINMDAAEGAKGKKDVYLTFDDGPAVHTAAVLDILDKYNIKATFFVVGDTEYTAYMKEIANRGHTVGLHSYDHNFEKIYKSNEAYFADLKQIDEIVFEHTGINSKIVRFPGGSSVKRGSSRARMNQLSKAVQERGYQYFDWNCESGDKAGVTSVSGALSRVKSTFNDCGDAVVVLMHDTEKVTVNALPGIIEFFAERGCEFKTLTPSSPAVHHSW